MPKQLGEHFESLTELEKKMSGNPRRSTYGSNYQISTIGEVCSVGDGAHAKVVRHDSGILYLTSKNIGFGNLDLGEVDFISEEDYNKLFSENSRAIRRPMPGDVLIGIIGTFGNAYQYKSTDHFGVSSSVAILRPNQSVLDPTFLYYVVSSSSFKQAHYAYKGGSVQGYTNIPTIKYLPIPLPTINEQKGIAQILGTLDDKIELNRQMNKTLEAMAHALFKSWFVDFDPVYAKIESRQTYGMDAETEALFPDSFEDSPMGEIPKGWRVITIGEVVTINGRNVTKDYPYQTIKYIDISSVAEGRLEGTTNYYLVDAPSRAKRLVRQGDCIWSTVRPNRKSYLFIHNPEDNLVVSTGFAVLTPRSIPPSYLYAWVTTDQFVDYLAYNADGSAYPAVLPDRFADGIILLPPAQILQEFERQVGPIRELIAQNEDESRTLAAIRDALLPKLLSGEIRVKDART